MSSTADAPREIEASWNRVVLICGACRKRGSGPKKSKAAAIVERLRAGLRQVRPRPRLVTTGCLGPCPKKAVTVAVPGPDGTTRVWAIASAGQVDAVLAESPQPAPSPS